MWDWSFVKAAINHLFERHHQCSMEVCLIDCKSAYLQSDVSKINSWINCLEKAKYSLLCYDEVLVLPCFNSLENILLCHIKHKCNFLKQSLSAIWSIIAYGVAVVINNFVKIRIYQKPTIHWCISIQFRSFISWLSTKITSVSIICYGKLSITLVARGVQLDCYSCSRLAIDYVLW